jgi:Xaa-Pro dipeptidase
MISRRRFLEIGGLSVYTMGLDKSAFSLSSPGRTSELENMVGDVKPLTPADFEKRLEKAKKLMAEHDIDGLFLTGSTDLRYFTNVRWGRSERTFGAVLNRKGNPIWVCPDFETDRAEEQLPKNHEVRTWEEHESPYNVIGGIMKDLGGSRLALGPTVRSFVAYGLRKDAPQIEQVDGAFVTENCRVIKTEKEVGYIELASKITKLAHKHGFSKLREGMSARDIATIYEDAHRQMGVDGYGNAKIGANSAFPHGSSVERKVTEGSIVLVSGGCTVEGFNCDVDRTTVFGTPTDKHRQVFDVVKKAQTAAIQASRPGMACEDVDAVARKVMEDAGFGPRYKYFKHRLGHGVGMDGHEYTYLVKGNKVKLQPGMVFSCEPAIYIDGEFGLRIEDDWVVTEDGARLLGGMYATAIDKPLGA